MSDGLTIEDANMRQAKADEALMHVQTTIGLDGQTKDTRCGNCLALLHRSPISDRPFPLNYREQAIREVLEIVDIEQVMCLNCLSGQWICDYDSLKSKIEALI